MHQSVQQHDATFLQKYSPQNSPSPPRDDPSISDSSPESIFKKIIKLVNEQKVKTVKCTAKGENCRKNTADEVAKKVSPGIVNKGM